MRHRTLLLASACTLLVFAGWATRNFCRGRAELTADVAKIALVELSETSDDSDLRRFLESLKREELNSDDGGKVARSGPLTCDLSARTFVFDVGSTDGFIEWSGTFDRQNGKWVARVEAKRHAHN